PVHHDCLSVISPRHRLCLLVTSPARTEEEGKQLEEHVHREEPPEVVRQRYPKVATALLPDPDLVDGRGRRVKAEVPHHHEKGGDERNGKGRQRTGPAAHLPDE